MAGDRDEVIDERDREGAQSDIDSAEERLRVLRMEWALYDNPWWDQYREWLAEQLDEMKTKMVETDPHDIATINLLQGTCRQTMAQIERRDALVGEIGQVEEEIRSIQRDWTDRHPAVTAGGATGGA